MQQGHHGIFLKNMYTIMYLMHLIMFNKYYYWKFETKQVIIQMLIALSNSMYMNRIINI